MSKSVMSLIAGTVLLALMPLAALAADTPQKPYVPLDKSLTQLRADFNANVGSNIVRFDPAIADALPTSEAVLAAASRSSIGSVA